MSARNDPQRRLAFDARRFYADIEAIASKRGMSMHKLSFEVGVHNSTLSYMNSRGKTPDGVNLAALCKWSGLNPADYSIDREQLEIAR